MKLKPLSKDTLEALRLQEELYKIHEQFNKITHPLQVKRRKIEKQIRMLEVVIPIEEKQEYNRQIGINTIGYTEGLAR
jgi:hypothetical protein